MYVSNRQVRWRRTEMTKEILKEKNIDLIYEEDLNKFLINKNKNLEFGARPLRRTIQNLVEDKLAEEILDGKLVKGKVNKITKRQLG